MNKLNCWEFMKCGEGPSGNGNSKAGNCNVAKESSADALNGGINGGRICWIVFENSCAARVKCSDLHRTSSCFSCKFRYKVMADEGLLNVCRNTGFLLGIYSQKKEHQRRRHNIYSDGQTTSYEKKT